MSALSQPARMTAEDYFAFELTQEDTWELIDGRPVRKWKPDPVTGMAGGTRAHHRVAENVSFALRQRLKGRPCFAMREQRVLIPHGSYRYPDVTVDCGAAQGMKDQAAAEPRVVFEVESPSNSEIDAPAHFQQKCCCGFVPENAPIQTLRASDPTKSDSDFVDDALERLEDFQSIPSVQEIVILSQTAAKARLYVREGAGWRGETLHGLEAELPLASLGCALPFTEIYEAVELASP